MSDKKNLNDTILPQAVNVSMEPSKSLKAEESSDGGPVKDDVVSSRSSTYRSCFTSVPTKRAIIMRFDESPSFEISTVASRRLSVACSIKVFPSSYINIPILLSLTVALAGSLEIKLTYFLVSNPTAVSPEQSTTSKPGKTTPKKRVAAGKPDATTPQKKRTPVKATKAEDAEAQDGVEEAVTPRRRKAPSAPVTPSRPIPANFEAADEADRMLVKMKDDGLGWAEIRAAWTKSTGESPGASTLPNRYNRLKANFIEFSQEDVSSYFMIHGVELKSWQEQRLLAAKTEVEAKFAVEKWTKIADAMEASGSRKYSTIFIQKKLKEVEKKAEAGKVGNVAAGHGTEGED
ncbi:MAG: hypothetical protein M1830_010234 [Pleopsidium flavum]|nr:MAG: hypothetical protein M1830_010234 [Pleopsidium flavum]